MKCNTVIKSLMKEQGHTYKTLSEALGYTAANTSYERLRGNMRVDSLLTFLEVLNGELVIRTKDGREFLITEGEKND